MNELCDYLRSQGVTTAYLFGSRAWDDGHSDSDWDIAVEFGETLNGLKAHSRLALLEIEAKRILGGPVDLIDLSMAHLTLVYECIWRGRCLFAPNEEERIKRELEIRRRFEDYQHIQGFYTRALRERLEDAS